MTQMASVLVVAYWFIVSQGGGLIRETNYCTYYAGT